MTKARGWSRPDARVATLSLWLGVATIAAHALRIRSVGLPADPDPMPLGILLVAFALTEGFAVHVRVRRGGHAMSLSEIPMVLGLLSVDPTLLLCVRLIGGVIGLAGLRGQRGVKLGFNVALLGVQTTAAAVLLRALSGPVLPTGPKEWLLVLIVMLVSDAIAAVLVTAVIALHDDPGEWKRLPGALQGMPLVAITTSIGLVSVLAIEKDPRAIVLLTIVSAVTYRAYRTFVQQSQGHQQVEELYAFTRALDGSLDTGGVARIVLEQARDQLRAERAELIVPNPDGTHVRLRMHGRRHLDISTVDALPETAWWQPARTGAPVLVPKGSRVIGSIEDGIAVPVPLSDGAAGVLLVADSLADIPTFGEQQLRLFQALANHASLSLAKARLLDELRREVAQNERLALYDPLTGLPNRQRFSALVDELRAAGTPLTVLLMDLDRFKEINDALGHDVGDQLLRQVGERLQERVDGRGTVARLGGDEFAVLLPEIRTREVALAVGDDLDAAMEQPIPIGDLRLNARVSIGVALAPEHGHDAKTLIQRADVAMYVAKTTHAGVRVYTSDDDRNSPRRLAMVADLREAIQRHDIVVVFQPKIETATGLVVGAEALARWHHPAHGFVPPDEFIPLAEHSGLIRPLTLHVLEVSLRRCATWRRMGHDIHVAVNLSPNSLQESDLPDIVARLLGQTGVPASALTLEITESSIMADPTGAMVILDRLHALGVKLAIDDFGTGYSSLGRLRELPIHEMKIDRSFVQRIAVDHRDRAVVRSAVQLGHALDLMVVAEGVEDEHTLLHLRQEGCNLVQGFFISKPLPADDFADWLTARIPQLGGA
ncbi:putative bifunctional diguanylate cyclase/phosphodiesterase [Dactylosporangium salmoneum]|uniref:Diguanylate cyclase/phosphodiesterase n=1 Tax=Dactylosporangium salmoneum TaxID=53361 RepID=A0ABN3GXA3_9ACTN